MKTIDLDTRRAAFGGPRLFRAAALVVLALLTLVGAWSSYFTVEPEERAVLKRFGAVVGEPLPPGLHFKLPFGIDWAYPVPTERILKQEFGFRTRTAGLRGHACRGAWVSTSVFCGR